MAAVTLREITKESLRSVLELSVTREQDEFVAPVSISISEAHFEPGAWMRAIYADDDPVGFVMTFEAPEREVPFYYLWRFLIDKDHQRKGYGIAAMELLIDRVRSLGAPALQVSWVPADGGPEPFYRKLGFEPTGEIHDGEVVAVLTL